MTFGDVYIWIDVLSQRSRRRSFIYICGIITITRRPSVSLLHQPRYQFGEFDEIRNHAQRAASANDNLRIRCNQVGPLLRHRANLILVDAQQEPCPVPVVPLADADELPPAERVEWVGHAHKARVRVRDACIPS